MECCFPASDLEKYNGTLPFEVHVDGWEKCPAISLCEAAQKSATMECFCR